MRIALDTNILAYAEGVGDKLRCSMAIRLLEQLPPEVILIPAQTMGELFRVLTGKAGRDSGLSREAIMSWADSYEIADSSWAAFQAAMDLSVDHQLQIWDALIMSVAAENRCRLLLSEDLQSGFTWRGISVLNPFVSPSPPLLEKYFIKNS
jgi:predicted nucleic acid-binding protein